MALNVLVVDDSLVMRDMIKKTLRLSDLPLGDIYEASNGQEGLEVLENNWIDLALVDIHMPVMNGEEMLASIRENPEIEDLGVIVVSSESSQTKFGRFAGVPLLAVSSANTAEALASRRIRVNTVRVVTDFIFLAPFL